ncbi:MAG: hypothetical protein KGI49_01865 [Patescibacteria group bacterium]|nr:hypothetical protein [Patescibacteria group bacterium]
MNTKLLSPRALSVIDQYLHFKVGRAVCSVPYFNNKTARVRNALAVNVGKGSPKEIFDEVQTILTKNHVDQMTIADDSLKKMLVDHNIGIDCSAFAFYTLNAESEEQGKGTLERHIKPIKSNGLISRMFFALNPVKNIGVSTFVNDKNSKIISLSETKPGDIITMLSTVNDHERNHILVVHQVEYQNFNATKIHYSHAVAYPEDGLYGTGIKQGAIDVADATKSLTEQVWRENGTVEGAARIFGRAKSSKTELRRLKAFA